jgi:two-component system sensor histidine kinase and response regulator WspE
VAKKLNKQAQLEIAGKSTQVDRDILEKLEAPLTHILRNAIDHGIETPEERIAKGKPPTGTIRLEAAHRAGMLSITIADDGRGINLAQLRQKILQRGLATETMVNQMTDSELIDFLFLPGFSTASQVTEISGRGVGLDIVQSMVQEVGGIVRASSQLGKGTTFHLQLPLTLSVIRTLLVTINGETYAFPLSRIDAITLVSQHQIHTLENREYFTFNDQQIGIVSAAQVWQLPPMPCLATKLRWS